MPSSHSTATASFPAPLLPSQNTSILGRREKGQQQEVVTRRKAKAMLLGKRPRPAMRRTTSLTEFSHDHACASDEPVVALPSTATTGNGVIKRSPEQQKLRQRLQQQRYQGPPLGSFDAVLSQPFAASPRNPRRHSADFAVEATRFLHECGLCRRSLGPGRDTFMYRGEMAFCSLECRQQQMAMDERKEKRSMASAVAKSPFRIASGTKATVATATI